MSFEQFGLHPSLAKVLPEIGYEKPTAIQVQAIPLVMQGRDLLGSAQTGTGKTAAFLLPVLHRLLIEPGEGTQVLVLEPTRELAVQVEEQARTYSKYSGLRSACVYGGMPFGPQEKAFKDGVEVIAATPGRLLDHLRQGNVRFDKMRVLVLDEVDRMLDMGFLPDVRAILRQLPEKRQTLFFSATVPGEIGRLADSMLNDPARVAITPERKTAEGITQQIYPVSDHLKPLLLERMLNHEHVTSALVFTRTKQGADKVCAVVERQGLNVARIHGDLSQSQRLKALTDFKEGQVKFLVATDIAARGLDVDGISHVINYDLPDAPEDYVHRIGRTARAGETGHAVSLFSPRDAAALSAIERHLAIKIDRIIMSDFNYDETLGVQHEVRQGHNVRDFDDLGRNKGAFAAERPRPWRDADEKAGVTLLYTADATVAEAVQEAPPSAGREGGRDGGRDGGRGKRRGRGGSSSGSGRDRAPRTDNPRSSEGESRPQEDRGENRQAGRSDGRDRHQTNASLSANDVLRKASDQKAVVSSDMMDLRPKSQDEEGEDEAPAPQNGSAPRVQPNGDRPQSSESGDPLRRKRRRRRGRGGSEVRQGQAPTSAQGGQRFEQRPGSGRRDQGFRGDRDGKRYEDRGPRGGGPAPVSGPKLSLWQKLKSSLGLGTGSGSMGDKW